MFRNASVLLINKIDLLNAGADFDTEKVKTDTRKLNKDIQIFEISAKTGQGMTNWCNWLEKTSRQISDS